MLKDTASAVMLGPRPPVRASFWRAWDYWVSERAGVVADAQHRQAIVLQIDFGFSDLLEAWHRVAERLVAAQALLPHRIECFALDVIVQLSLTRTCWDSARPWRSMLLSKLWNSPESGCQRKKWLCN